MSLPISNFAAEKYLFWSTLETACKSLPFSKFQSHGLLLQRNVFEFIQGFYILIEVRDVKKMTLVPSAMHDIKWKTIASLNKQMKREHIGQTSELIERDSLSYESWKGKYNLKYLYNIFYNYAKDNWLYVCPQFLSKHPRVRFISKKYNCRYHKCRRLTANLPIPGPKRSASCSRRLL